MAFQYTTEAMPTQWNTSSNTDPSYYYNVNSLSWVPNTLAIPQNTGDDQYWQEVSDSQNSSECSKSHRSQIFWNQVDSEISASPTSYTSSSFPTQNQLYGAYPASPSISSQSSSSRQGSEDFSISVEKNANIDKKTVRYSLPPSFTNFN